MTVAPLLLPPIPIAETDGQCSAYIRDNAQTGCPSYPSDYNGNVEKVLESSHATQCLALLLLL